MALDKKKLKAIINAHVSKAQKEHATWDKWRAWYRSEFWGELQNEDSDSLLVENNYLYAFTDTMVASVTPPTPRVTCVPRKKDEETALAAQYREALINDVLYRCDAHEILWQMSTFSSVYGRSIIKGVWNFSKNRPDFLVIDPRYFFFDLSVRRWDDIRYAIEVTTLTKAEFFARVKGKSNTIQYDKAIADKVRFGSFPKWLSDKEDTSVKLSEEVKKVFEWVVIYEVYDFTRDRYYHMIEDSEEPLFEGDLPYTFVRNPFDCLMFNDNLADIGGMADSQLVERQQRRLNELDTLELRHAQASVPVTIINEALCDNPEDFVDQVATATSPGDVVRLMGKNAAPVGDILGTTPTASLVPEFSSIRTRIESTIQFVLGIPDYARGVAGSSEVATELALLDSAMRTRLGRRTKLINGILQHMARTIVGLYEEFLNSSEEIPVRVSGQKEAVTVARKHLSARDPGKADQMKARGENIEEPLDIDYEVVPYSPTENSKAAQTKKLTQFMDLFLQSPHIDQRRLMVHLLELLDIGKDVLVSEEVVQAQQAQQAQMQELEGKAAEAGGKAAEEIPGTEDALANGGGAPGGPSPIPPEAVYGMAGGAGVPAPEGEA